MVFSVVVPSSATPVAASPVTKSSNPLPESAFEGPEKSLRVRVAPLTATATLRRLSRRQIDSLLQAARCAVLSVVSNDNMDAYLLSESSLFVADHFLTMKTCGTTTLLHALPVILELAASVDCAVAEVQFSRAAYLFPAKQLFPHGSFDEEVAHLDLNLGVRGTVTTLGDALDDAHWYSYSATLLPDTYPYLSSSSSVSSSDTRSSDRFIGSATPPSCLSDGECGAARKHPCCGSDYRATTSILEVCMFDLDPDVMAAFHFDKVPERIGHDDADTGTTMQTGVSGLLDGCEEIDAFNFEPCGYSVNALGSDGGYATIHVTPETGASYVSFETTTRHVSTAALVARVVRLFAPRRFVVATIGRPDLGNDRMCEGVGDLSVNAVIQHLGYTYNLETTARSKEDGSRGVAAALVVTVAQDCGGGRQGDRMDGGMDGVGEGERKVGLWVDNVGVDANVSNVGEEASRDKNVGGMTPTIVVDLERVKRNVRALRGLAPAHPLSLRFPARSTTDGRVLRELCGLGVCFEAGGRTDVERLERAGVERGRIALADPGVMAAVADLFARVGRVVVGACPEPELRGALRDAGVEVELRGPLGDGWSKEEAVAQARDGGRGLCVVAVQMGRGVAAGGGGERAMAIKTAWASAQAVGASEVVVCGDAEVIGEAVGGAGDVRQVTAVVGSEVLAGAVGVEVTVIGRRVRDEAGGGQTVDYFVDDGVYGAFAEAALRGAEVPRPRVVGRKRAAATAAAAEWSTVWGPTCDSMDRLWAGWLAEVEVGDRLAFDGMTGGGAHSATSFNGFGTRYGVRYA